MMDDNIPIIEDDEVKIIGIKSFIDKAMSGDERNTSVLIGDKFLK